MTINSFCFYYRPCPRRYRLGCLKPNYSGLLIVLTGECVKSTGIGCHNLKLRKRNSSRHIFVFAASFERPGTQFVTVLISCYAARYKAAVLNVSIGEVEIIH